MPRFVLEIGTEEIPPRFFPPALSQLREEGEKMLRRGRLSFDEVAVHGTPRRLVLVVEGLAEKQAAETREERGPAAKVAFDADGNPTKAAEGFARRYGLQPGELVVRETEQGEYVFAVVREAELPAKEALSEALPALVTGLSFPKSMRWGSSSVRFGRPIRWLLALLGEDVVEFSLEHLRSDRLTRGHPVLSDGMHEVRGAAAYEEVLRSHFVIVDPRERWDEVLNGVMTARPRDAVLACPIRPWNYTLDHLVTNAEVFAREMDVDLSLQTTFTVEFPAAALGRFDETFLTRLPREILIEEMQHIQSYFPLRPRDDDRTLVASFIAVRDGGDSHLGKVVRGWENVLRAKLIDATYFYEGDRALPLAHRVEDLKGVVFHEKLGTMYDKVQRVKAIAVALSEVLDLSQQRADWLKRAAALCKADLTTQVVAELSSLQGAVGGIYAGEDGEPEEVAAAIRDHYMPRFADDDTPHTTIGTFLAVADKLDTLAACFAVGVIPTGSADPFALRREGTGIVKCLILDRPGPLGDAPLHEKYSQMPVRPLIELVLEQLAVQGIEFTADRGHITDAVFGFLGERLDTIMRDEGVRYDLARAALAVGVDPVRLAYERGHALRRLSTEDRFLPTVIACTRPINIAKGFEGGDVDSGLFQEPAEHALWDAYQKVAAEAESADPIELFAFISEQLREPIDRYFDDVLVMAEDETLRRNRLALCWQLSQLFRRLGDLSLIVQA